MAVTVRRGSGTSSRAWRGRTAGTPWSGSRSSRGATARWGRWVCPTAPPPSRRSPSCGRARSRRRSCWTGAGTTITARCGTPAPSSSASSFPTRCASPARARSSSATPGCARRWTRPSPSCRAASAGSRCGRGTPPVACRPGRPAGSRTCSRARSGTTTGSSRRYARRSTSTAIPTSRSCSRRPGTATTRGPRSRSTGRSRRATSRPRGSWPGRGRTAGRTSPGRGAGRSISGRTRRSTWTTCASDGSTTS